MYDCLAALKDTSLLEDAVKENEEATAKEEAAGGTPETLEGRTSVVSVDGSGSTRTAILPAHKAEMSYQTHFVVRIVLNSLNVTSLVLQVNVSARPPCCSTLQPMSRQQNCTCRR